MVGKILLLLVSTIFQGMLKIDKLIQPILESLVHRLPTYYLLYVNYLHIRRAYNSFVHGLEQVGKLSQLTECSVIDYNLTLEE